MAVCIRGGEPSLHTNPAGTLIWDFQPPYCEKTNICSLSPPVCSILLWQLPLTKIGTEAWYDIAHYSFVLPGDICVC